MDDERFIVDYVQQGTTKNFHIIIDRETGVNYLYVKMGNSAGLTPLLNETGKPVIYQVGQTERSVKKLGK